MQHLHATGAAPASATSSNSRHRIAAWLFVCCFLVFVMVVVGGVTRLTRSGLSITEWQPVAGALPPLSEAAWETLFAKYQATPEYHKVNRGMTLDDFKGIFWWEYLHRLLGRAIGVVFLVPLVWFAIRRQIGGALGLRLAAIFCLGGLQGGIGWWMVKSGLVDTPRVDHVRLALHLGMAFLIFAAMFWTALGLRAPPPAGPVAPERKRVANLALVLSVLIFAMVLSGALVAGTRAGYAYNTFPLMDGHWIPPGAYAGVSGFDDVFHDLTTVQFNHRVSAWVLFFAIPAFWGYARRTGVPEAARRPLNLLLAMLFVQVALGILTLVLHVPVALGAAHQGGALVFFALALWVAHALRLRRG